MKKLLSILLAVTLIFSMSSMALAADPIPGPSNPVGASGVTGDIGGIVEVPKIYMQLPTIGDTTLLFDTYNQLGEGKQVLSSNLTFVNYSVVPVELSLSTYKATTNSGNAITGVSDDTLVNDDTTTKNMLLWVNTAIKDAKGQDVKVDGKFTFPDYDKATLTSRVFTDYTGVSANSTAVFGTAFRGTAAKQDVDGTIDREPIAPAILGSRNSLTLRLDGMMNSKATWDDGEVITITPVFSIKPLEFDPDEEPSSGVSLTADPTSAAMSAAAIKGMSGLSGIVLNVGTAPKATLTTDDYTLTIGSGTIDTTKTVVTVSGSKVNITVKATGVSAGDSFSFTLKPSAFTTPTPCDTVTIPVVA